MSVYGHEVVKTPHLAALAADGLVFEYAFAQAPSTTPSHASMFTGRYPSHHQAVNGISIRSEVPTFTEALRAAGYHTAAFVAATPLRSTDSGLHRGFDRYEDSLVPWSTLFGRDEFQQLALFQTLDLAVGTSLPGRVVTARVLDWLRERPEQRFFAWVHYFDPHQQTAMSTEDYPNLYAGMLDPTLPLVERREHYASRVTYTDAQVGRVIAELKSQGLYDDTLIIVTSDHGEGFGEQHDEIVEISHARYLFDTTQRVPLIIKPPRSRGAGRRVERQVQLVDLASTILDSAGLPVPSSFSGVSLRSLLEGGTELDAPEVAYLEHSQYHLPDVSETWQRSRILMALRTPKVKYICNRDGDAQRLYDLEVDPEETTNLADERPDEAKRYRDELFAVLTRDENAPAPEMDPRVLEKLQALGYLIEEE